MESTEDSNKVDHQGKCSSEIVSFSIDELPKSVGDQSVNVELLNQLEAEANKVAASVDDLTENLTGILRSISALTLDCLETYRNCICKTCDAIDYNIKLMYQLMAKCEELSKVAEPLNALAQNTKDIKNILDQFDHTMNPW